MFHHETFFLKHETSDRAGLGDGHATAMRPPPSSPALTPPLRGGLVNWTRRRSGLGVSFAFAGVGSPLRRALAHAGSAAPLSLEDTSWIADLSPW